MNESGETPAIQPERKLTLPLQGTMVSVYNPEAGYLCKVSRPTEPGAPYMVAPIQTIEEMFPNESPYDRAQRLVQSEMNKKPSENPEESPAYAPVFREQTTMLMLQDNNLQDTPTNIFDVDISDIQTRVQLENDPRYVFIPKHVLMNADALRSKPSAYNDAQDAEKTSDISDTVTLAVGGRSVEAYVHPDCKKLIRRDEKPLELNGSESPKERRKIAKKIIRTVDMLDRGYEKVSGEPDRLSLDHIEALRDIIPDEKLMDDLEAAYIKERLITMGLQTLSTSFNAGILQTFLHNQDGRTLIALAGATMTEVVGEVTEEKTFSGLLNTTLARIPQLYDLSAATITGLENNKESINDFARDAAVDLSSRDAMKSKTIAKWGSLVANTAVLAANNQWTEAAIYAGLGSTANVLGDTYRRRVQEFAELQTNAPSDVTKDPEWQNRAKTLIWKGIGSFGHASANYAQNIAVSIPGLSPVEKELLVHSLSFIASNQGEQASRVPDSVDRTQELRVLDQLISWGREQANELRTESQYQRYCAKRAQELAHAGTQSIQLPDRDVLTGEASVAYTHRPRQVIASRPYSTRDYYQGSTNQEDIIAPDLLSPRKIGDEVRTYPVIDAAIKAKHGDGAVEPPKKTALFVDVHGGSGGAGMLLNGANLLAESGKVIEIQGNKAEVSQVLAMLAQQKKTDQGTTYVRTDNGDVNVHLDHNRRDIRLYQGDESGVTNMLQQIANGTETVVVIDNPFGNIHGEQEIEVTKKLKKIAENKVVIIHGDAMRIGYKPELARMGAIESYRIKGGRFVSAKPTHEQIVYELSHRGIVEDERLQKKLATEIERNLTKLRIVDGELKREVEVIRANIFTIGPDGKKYRLVRGEKIQQGSGGTAIRADRSKDPYSFYRSVEVDGDRDDAFLHRLTQMNLVPDPTNHPPEHPPFIETEEKRMSREYSMETTYHFHTTDVTVPYTEKVTAFHGGGGYMDFEWRPVVEEEISAAVASLTDVIFDVDGTLYNNDERLRAEHQRHYGDAVWENTPAVRDMPSFHGDKDYFQYLFRAEAKKSSGLSEALVNLGIVLPDEVKSAAKEAADKGKAPALQYDQELVNCLKMMKERGQRLHIITAAERQGTEEKLKILLGQDNAALFTSIHTAADEGCEQKSTGQAFRTFLEKELPLHESDRQKIDRKSG